MAAKGGIAFPGMVEAFIKLMIGVILAAVVLALGWLAFEAIAGNLVNVVSAADSKVGLSILAGAVIGGVSIIVAGTMLSIKK